jgi:hypothetical protein
MSGPPDCHQSCTKLNSLCNIEILQTFLCCRIILKGAYFKVHQKRRVKCIFYAPYDYLMNFNGAVMKKLIFY